MNFLKSKVLLKKINAIHDSAESFDNKFSALERDLMLQYLRDLYECVSDQDLSTMEDNKGREVRNVQPVVAPPESPAVTPRVEQIAVAQHNPQSNGKHRPAETPSMETTSVMTAPAAAKPVEDADLAELFDELGVPDMSQRFGNAPVADLSKAMGINERILTINELFKGDQQVFQDVVKHLNGLTSFEEARQYLIHGMAKANDWASDKKIKKAAVFIKLVRRRY